MFKMKLKSMFNVKPKMVLSLSLLTLSSVSLFGCSSTDYINQEEVSQIKTAAVVIYSVPQEIVADNRDATQIDRDKSQNFEDMNFLSIAGNLVGGATKKVTDFLDSESDVKKNISGTEAADIALPQFISEMRKLKGWSFKTPTDVASNSEYQALSAELLQDQDIKLERSSTRIAKAPTNYVEIGLPYNHTATVDYYENPQFKLWAEKTANALDVDAIIVMNDTGFATDGQSFFSGANCYTKSAFHFAMFNKKGEKIVDTRSAFEESTIIPQQGCVDGAFLKSDYINALKQHGKDQAKVIVEKLNTIKS